MNTSPVANTIRFLKACRAKIAGGGHPPCTNDPAWLIDMAINRRAGWPDDPTHCRGSAMPVNGAYPKKAAGDAYNHLRLLADKINRPRLIVRPSELGEWRRLLLERIPDRFTWPEDE